MNWKTSVILALVTHAIGFKGEIIHYDDLKATLNTIPEARVLLKANGNNEKPMTEAIRKLLTTPVARDIILDFYSWVYLRYALRPSEKIISPSVHLEHFTHDNSTISDQEILDILEILNDGGMPPAFQDFLCLYGSVHGHLRGPWSEAVISTLDTCKTRFGFACLPHLCTEAQYCKLMGDHATWITYESALLRYLMYVPVTEHFINGMTNPIFAVVPCSEDLHSALPKIIRGPNRNLLCTCWHNLFRSGFKAGEHMYPFAALSVAIWESEGKYPVEEAADLLSGNHEEIALGMSSLAMLCTSEPLFEYLDDTSAAMVAVLTDSSNPAFYAAANLAVTLIEEGLLDPKVLDSDSIFLALIDNVDISAGRQAEVLLSLLPLRDRSHLLKAPILRDLQKRYKKFFNYSTMKEDFYSSYGEISYAMLYHTGYFKSDGERRSAFEKLLDHIRAYRDECRTCDLARIQILADQVYNVRFDKVACDVSIAPEAVNKLKDIAAADRVIPYSAEYAAIEAAACIRFRPTAFSENESITLLQRPIEVACPLDPQTVTEWFFLLCWYGMSQNAIDFFEKHTYVLTKPLYFPMYILNEEDEDSEYLIERAYSCVNTGSNYLSRVALGVHIMELGHGEAAEALKQHPAIKPFYKEVDHCHLSAEESFLIRAMKYRHFLGLGAACFSYDSAYQVLLDFPPI